MTTMNISLTDELKAFVDEQIATGNYTTSSEYMRALIRKEKERHTLKAVLVEGAAAGLSETAQEAYVTRVQNELDKIQNAELPETVMLEDLQTYIQHGINSGTDIPADDVLDRLDTKYRKLADHQG